MEDRTHNNITEFLLIGFPTFVPWHWTVFFVFLIMYMLTLTGNIIIIIIVRTDSCLSSPMYFFISNLSFIEILYTSVTIPKLLALVIGRSLSITFNNCLIQFYFFFSLGATECFLLTAMSYDRYIAICNPLHYIHIMSHSICVYLVLASWTGGFVLNLFPVFLISKLKFCGRNIQHFFCDLSPLLKLACQNTYDIETLNFFTAFAIVLFSFSITLVTYIRIIITILSISSSLGRQKAFSTCASHLIVVLIFYGALAFVYVRPRASTSFELNKFLSMIYIIVTPIANPLIYSLRNKDAKMAIKKVIFKKKL
ncbi:olfactory receptor 6B9-like [Pelobates fuscus]|uniref:olfactory receptor 6B9-like n=1 Tax=Pelobates fuscus TaxID=191477 RepID=UPI002FE46658